MEKHYCSEKSYWLMVLDERKRHFLYEKEPRDFDGAEQIREMQDLILLDKVKDYSILEDFGLDVEMPLPKYHFMPE